MGDGQRGQNPNRELMTTLQDRGVPGDTVYEERWLGDEGFNKKEDGKCLHGAQRRVGVH